MTDKPSNANALLRIAKAVEKMASSYDDMRAQRDWWKAKSKHGEAENMRLQRVIRSLRGALTKNRKEGAR